MIVKFYKRDFEKKLTENFKIKEFACKGNDSDFLLINFDLAKKLQEKIRDKYRTPIIITSGFRTTSYNLKCGGSPKSKHLEGNAIDFTFSDKKLFIEKYREIIQDLISAGINGIGLYIKDRETPFIHIDNRPTKCYWINENGNNRYVENFNEA